MPAQETEAHLFNETGDSLPVDNRLLEKALSEVTRQEACSFRLIELVYVDEQKITELNKEHLGRDYVTDIITFRYDDDQNKLNIEGTLFCCAPRIKEQAAEYDEEEKTEFLRVLIHGLLHLIGYDDQSEQDREQMREREDFYLDIIHY